MLLLTLVSAIGGFLFGYDTGVVSGALLKIAEDFTLSPLEEEAVVSVTTVGAVIGALMGGQANERFGRKPVILFSSVVFTVGAVVMGAAPDLTVSDDLIRLLHKSSSPRLPVEHLARA